MVRLLHQMGSSLRVNAKNIAIESSPDRHLQFESLTELRCQFQRLHLPIISVDTKKRELVGNFKNPGRRWEEEERRVFDHDFRTDSIGVAIPMAFMTFRTTAALSSSVFPTTRRPSRLAPSPTGGVVRDLVATVALRDY